MTEAERAEFVRTVVEHPEASGGQVVAIFRAKTGRLVDRNAVFGVRRRGYKPAGVPGVGRHLSEAQRQVLERICRESAPGYNRSEVSRRFLAETGRPIHVSAVSLFMVRKLGLPKKPGPNRRRMG